MIYPRRFLRVSPNLHRSKIAKIICDPKQPTIDCTIIDYAPGGACLEVSGPIVLPGSSCSGQAQRKSAGWSGVKEGEPVSHFKGLHKRMQRWPPQHGSGTGQTRIRTSRETRT